MRGAGPTDRPMPLALGAEEMDLHIEAQRVAEFAKFRPTYYLDRVEAVQLAGSRWRLLASVAIEDAEDAHFVGVIDKWTAAAESVMPPVERTEITALPDSATVEPAPPATDIGSNGRPSGGHGEALGPEIRRVRRLLIPKRKSKDSVLEEDVVLSRLGAGVYAQFIPRCSGPAQLPFYYPRVTRYALGFVDDEGGGHGTHRLEILVQELAAGAAAETPKQQAIWRDLTKRLYKWTVTERYGYQKRVLHDIVVAREPYLEKYHELKAKYAARWVEGWPEQTDPQKFVFEDIAIASWLICLWEQGGSRAMPKPTFADLGCGNGFLVYLLTSEGYSGYGVDQSARKIWTQYGIQVDLRAQTLEPYHFDARADWVIGNHADELAPWVPIIAARAAEAGSKFVVIPCCPHGLSGAKMALPAAAGQSKYHAYVNYISTLATQCGYEVEKEFLRIPSTKNVAIVGRSRTVRASQADVDALVKAAAHDFVPRVPDSVRNEIRLAKARSRSQATAEPGANSHQKGLSAEP
ncbi:tRNA(Ser) Um(44) 2'-O-methyltransferase [Coemansia biformis]|uniref:tRNA (uracil-O(2)-)-methyltransferase n=1 Tax=Coemansia biformis TaxID=1286918 RepID=A0A9W7YC45_9FUNG|nr:tRNA(Ser) Um(44) 2'-O-methyltransferase [Coemansia biformis]